MLKNEAVQNALNAANASQEKGDFEAAFKSLKLANHLEPTNSKVLESLRELTNLDLSSTLDQLKTRPEYAIKRLLFLLQTSRAETSRQIVGKGEQDLLDTYLSTRNGDILHILIQISQFKSSTLSERVDLSMLLDSKISEGDMKLMVLLISNLNIESKKLFDALFELLLKRFDLIQPISSCLINATNSAQSSLSLINSVHFPKLISIHHNAIPIILSKLVVEEAQLQDSLLTILNKWYSSGTQEDTTKALVALSSLFHSHPSIGSNLLQRDGMIDEVGLLPLS